MTFYSIFLCIFCVQMSDAYFCIDKVISSLCIRHLSFLAIISLPPHLINVTVWCFIYLPCIWAQHLQASDALPSRKEFPRLAWMVGALHPETSQYTSVLGQYGKRGDSLISWNEHCSDSGVSCIYGTPQDEKRSCICWSSGLGPWKWGTLMMGMTCSGSAFPLLTCIGMQNSRCQALPFCLTAIP